MQFQLYSTLQWSDLPFVLLGVWRTVLLTVVSTLLGTVLGLVLGWLREASAVARWAFAPYVDVSRSVPLIIQFVLVNSFFALAGVPLDPLAVGVVVLSLYMGVLTSELFRAGLQSVRPQLRKASRSLGMGYWHEMRHVSFPLAVRTVLPGWIGTVIGLTKDTALVSVVGYVELLRTVQILITRTNQALPILIGVGLFYFLICYPVSRYGRRLEASLKL